MTKARWVMAAAAVVLGLGLMTQPAPAATQVDLELALLVDVSGSISASEFTLQRTGYVNAFQNATIQNAITSGTYGSIAATLIYWSGTNQQQQAVGWTLIDSAASANAFAAAIAAAGRPYSGNTAPGSAINFTVPLFGSNDFDGTRQAIDISGDGTANEGANTPTARDNALAAGIDVINGLTIGGAAIQTWYQNNVIGGTNADGSPAFAIGVDNFDDFGAAIEQKLLAEVRPTVPEPSTIVSLGMGGLGLLVVALRRRRMSRAAA